MNIMRRPWIVSSAKLIRETGFTYPYSSRAAFEDFAKTTHSGVA